ncbi:signal transduction histidine kinase/CHASE3 domain sensor protein [Flavobacterium sp. PL11]|uniref:CHASE3 domain-containing protein n=1 Tax=Flavobacterium sp. PL11 TaxID=3071717 RepID=UPI002E04553F|nr:signal transduction histidine kinase/CHASE3 domain sensor protein [Flavobacterium sp. PL11]
MKYIPFHSSPLFLKIIFVISVAIIFFIGAITFKHITILKKSATYVNNSYEINIELERLLSYVKDAETGQRGFLLSNDKKFLEPYYNSRTLIKNSYKRVKQLTLSSEAQQNNLRQLKYYINKRQNYLSKNLYLFKDQIYDKDTIGKNLMVGKEAMDSIRIQIERLIVTQNHLLNERQQDYESTMNYTPFLIYLTLLITLILITIAFIKMNSDLILLKKTVNSLSVVIEVNKLSEIIGNFGSWQLDIQTGKYTFSDNQYRMLGCDPQSFIASKEEYNKFIHPDDIDILVKNTKDILTHNDLPAFTYRIIRKDGDIRYLRAMGQVVTIKAENKIYIGTTRDITEEINEVILTGQRNRELESNNKELNAFNYIASHDLQEPLRKIETFISRIISKDHNNLSELGKQYIASIQRSTNRMRVLIDDLLQFSRTNKTEKVFEMIDLNYLFENAKNELAQTIEEKSAIIETTNLPTLQVIPFQIQQLFVNLLGNSLKYSKHDSTPLIKIYYEKVTSIAEEKFFSKNNEFHKISIQDNGIGFEQEYAKNIFTLFSRLHNKNEYKGTGIGLAICKKIVENHKGFITAKGSLNEGSIFTIYLPV